MKQFNRKRLLEQIDRKRAEIGKDIYGHKKDISIKSYLIRIGLTEATYYRAIATGEMSVGTIYKLEKAGIDVGIT